MIAKQFFNLIYAGQNSSAISSKCGFFCWKHAKMFFLISNADTSRKLSVLNTVVFAGSAVQGRESFFEKNKRHIVALTPDFGVGDFLFCAFQKRSPFAAFTYSFSKFWRWFPSGFCGGHFSARYHTKFAPFMRRTYFGFGFGRMRAAYANSAPSTMRKIVSAGRKSLQFRNQSPFLKIGFVQRLNRQNGFYVKGGLPVFADCLMKVGIGTFGGAANMIGPSEGKSSSSKTNIAFPVNNAGDAVDLPNFAGYNLVSHLYVLIQRSVVRGGKIVDAIAAPLPQYILSE